MIESYRIFIELVTKHKSIFKISNASYLTMEICIVKLVPMFTKCNFVFV